MADSDNKVNDFLDEYAELCRKYGLYVSSCGCCDSPWVEDGKHAAEQIGDHLTHLRRVAGQLKCSGVKAGSEPARSFSAFPPAYACYRG